jgi:hypothetical protein
MLVTCTKYYDINILQSFEGDPLTSWLTRSSISLNSAEVVFLPPTALLLPCPGLCTVADLPRPRYSPIFVVIALLPFPVVMVEASDVRAAALFACGGARGELTAVPRCVRARGEPVRSVTVPRLCSGNPWLLFEACDELRDAVGLDVGGSFALLGRRIGSRTGGLARGPAPKTAGSEGFVRARWRGGVLGRSACPFADVLPVAACVSARLNGTLAFDVASASGAGVGEVAGKVFDPGISSPLRS